MATAPDPGAGVASVNSTQPAVETEDDDIVLIEQQSKRRSTKLRFVVLILVILLDILLVVCHQAVSSEGTENYEVLLLVFMSPVAYAVVHLQTRVRAEFEMMSDVISIAELQDASVVALSAKGFMMRQQAGMQAIWQPEVRTLMTTLRHNCHGIIPTHCPRLRCGAWRQNIVKILFSFYVLAAGSVYFAIPLITRARAGLSAFGSTNLESTMVSVEVLLGIFYVFLIFRLFSHFVVVFKSCTAAMEEFTLNTTVSSIEDMQQWVLTFEQFRVLFRQVSRLYSVPILVLLLADVYLTIQVVVIPDTVYLMVFLQLLIVSMSMNIGAIALVYYASTTTGKMTDALTSLLGRQAQMVIDAPPDQLASVLATKLPETARGSVDYLERQHCGFELLIGHDFINMPINQNTLLSVGFLAATNLYSILQQIWASRLSTSISVDL